MSQIGNWFTDNIQTITLACISILIIISFLIIVKKTFGGYKPRNILRGIDKLLSKSELRQVSVLLIVAVLIFVFLLFFGATICSAIIKDYEFSGWNVLSHYFNPGSFNKPGDIPNVLILVLNIFGMFLVTGLLISVLSNVLERRVEKVKNGQTQYEFSNHIVIIGYDKITVSLIKQYAKFSDEIILQTVQDIPKVRHELFSYIDAEIEKKITILSGNRNSNEDLEKLKFGKAKVIYLLGESREYNHDSINIECLKKIILILNKQSIDKRIPCHVLFENQTTFSILQQRDIPELKENKYIDFIPFNFHEKWAEKVFVDNFSTSSDYKNQNEYINYLPLDRIPIREDSFHTVHLVILGMSKMGIALGIEATHLCHFPNFINDKTLKTRITFIDRNADKEMHYLQGRYQSFFDEIRYTFSDSEKKTSENYKKEKKTYFTDVEWHFVKGNIEEPFIQQMLEDFSEEKNTLLTIAVCLNDPSVAIATGLYLRNKIYQDDKIQYFEQYKDRMIDLTGSKQSIKKQINEEDKNIQLEYAKGELADKIRIKKFEKKRTQLIEALELLEEEWNKFNVQILIKQNTPYSILSMLNCTDKYRNVKPFGMPDNCLDVFHSDNEEILAKRVHYIYDYYFDEKKNKNIPEKITSDDNDEINSKWNNIPTCEKWSNRYHTQMIGFKLRSFSEGSAELMTKKLSDSNDPYRTDLIELIAKVEHNRWNIEKLLMGFRPAKKQEEDMLHIHKITKADLKKSFIHPDIKEFDNLKDENIKDIDRMITKALPLLLSNSEQ